MSTLATLVALSAPTAELLLEDCSPAEEPASFGIRRALAPGMLLVRQFDPPGPMYVILSGTVRILSMCSGAQPREIARLGASDHVGEIGALLRVPRSASVEAITPVVALELSSDELGSLVDSDPAFAEVLGRHLRERTDGVPAALLATLSHGASAAR